MAGAAALPGAVAAVVAVQPKPAVVSATRKTAVRPGGSLAAGASQQPVVATAAASAAAAGAAAASPGWRRWWMCGAVAVLVSLAVPTAVLLQPGLVPLGEDDCSQQTLQQALLGKMSPAEKRERVRAAFDKHALRAMEALAGQLLAALAEGEEQGPGTGSDIHQGAGRLQQAVAAAAHCTVVPVAAAVAAESTTFGELLQGDGQEAAAVAKVREQRQQELLMKQNKAQLEQQEALKQQQQQRRRQGCPVCNEADGVAAAMPAGSLACWNGRLADCNCKPTSPQQLAQLDQQRKRKPLCTNGTSTGRWVGWLDWEADDCQYRQMDRMELQQCLRGKWVHFFGDSLSRMMAGQFARAAGFHRQMWENNKNRSQLMDTNVEEKAPVVQPQKRRLLLQQQQRGAAATAAMSTAARAVHERSKGDDGAINFWEQQDSAGASSRSSIRRRSSSSSIWCSGEDGGRSSCQGSSSSSIESSRHMDEILAGPFPQPSSEEWRPARVREEGKSMSNKKATAGVEEGSKDRRAAWGGRRDEAEEKEGEEGLLGRSFPTEISKKQARRRRLGQKKRNGKDGTRITYLFRGKMAHQRQPLNGTTEEYDLNNSFLLGLQEPGAQQPDYLIMAIGPHEVIGWSGRVNPNLNLTLFHSDTEELIALLRRTFTKGQLVWWKSHAILPGKIANTGYFNARLFHEQAQEFAFERLKREGVRVADFYQTTIDRPETVSPDGVHYTMEMAALHAMILSNIICNSG